jgi:Predicted metal-dependent hydrolase with the TIM-barrel fold
MGQLLLHNLRIIDPFGEREFLEHASILIEDEVIKFVGRGFSHVGFEGQILDMEGKTVLPGIINAHTHLYSTLALGMPPPQKPQKTLLNISKKSGGNLTEDWTKLLPGPPLKQD